MQRRRAALGLAALVLALAPVVAEAAPKPCAGTSVARTVAGTRTCVPAATLRAAVPTRPPVVQALADVLGPSPLRAAARRTLGDLRPPPPLLPKAFATLALARTATLEADVSAAAAAARQPTSAARILLAGPTVTKGPVTLTQNADGSVRASGSVRAVEGDRTIKVGIELGLDDQGALDRVGFSMDYDDAKGGASLGLAYSGKSTLPACPDATGAIAGNITIDLHHRKGERLRVGPIKVGSYSQSMRVVGKVAVRARLGADARLASIDYDYQESFEIAHSGNALAFLQSSWVAKVSTTAKGRLDPKTGEPLAGASVNTVPKATSAILDAAERRALGNALGKVGDQRLREGLGDVVKRLREIETNARTAGACVTIEAGPAPAWSLSTGATLPVQTTLKTKDGGTAVQTVDWSASAGLGSITPATSTAPTPTFTVTAAAPTGGQTARVAWHAVSPAGIADLEGAANDDPFPARIVGTIAVAKALAPFVQTTWTTSVVYAKETDRTNPDGSRTVLYALRSATIVSADYTQTPFGPCADAYGSIANVAGAVQAGDIEFIVGGTDPPTYAIQHDVAGTIPAVPRGCPVPPPPPPPPFDVPAGAFLYTGRLAFAGLPLQASGLALANAPGQPGTMGWSLAAR